MQRRLARVFFAVAAVVIGLVGVSRPAEADFTMTLSDGNSADTQVINLVGPVDAFSATVGSFFVGGVANLTLNPSVADTMTQMSYTIDSSSPGTLTITLTATDLTLVGPVGSLVSDVGASALSNGSSFSFQSYYDATNSGSTSGLTTGLEGPYANPGQLPNYNNPANIVTMDLTAQQPTGVGGTLSMTSVLTFNAGGANAALAATGTTSVTAAPEPATLGMAVMGATLGGIIYGARRMRRSGKDSANGLDA